MNKALPDKENLAACDPPKCVRQATRRSWTDSRRPQAGRSKPEGARIRRFRPNAMRSGLSGGRSFDKLRMRFDKLRMIYFGEMPSDDCFLSSICQAAEMIFGF
jgi:hypothetical protein